MDDSKIMMATSLPKVHDSCTVLVVDDDPVCLGELLETVKNLGYPALSAANGFDALRQIAVTPDVGIVVTDVDMPTMDGISLISEILKRFSATRPIVTLVVTGYSSLQIATSAMQSQAVDLLSKPVSVDALAAALRRAFSYQLSLAFQFQIKTFTEGIHLPVAIDRLALPNIAPTEPEMQRFVQMLLKIQHSKSKFFDTSVLAGPPWEVLLILAEASLRGEAISASKASASTLMPLCSVLRHVNNLVAAALVQRKADPMDKRSFLLELEPSALAQMQRYLESAWKLQQRLRDAKLTSPDYLTNSSNDMHYT